MLPFIKNDFASNMEGSDQKISGNIRYQAAVKLKIEVTEQFKCDSIKTRTNFEAIKVPDNISHSAIGDSIIFRFENHGIIEKTKKLALMNVFERVKLHTTWLIRDKK